jgi:peroxiredoxin
VARIFLGEVAKIVTQFLSSRKEWRLPLNRVLILSVVVILSLTFHTTLFAANTSLMKGEKLPAINLPIPKNPNEKIYLGLSGDGVFKISQIKAQAVLIKIFNLYCPICQSTAGVMTEIYKQVENNPTLKGKIKLIGIGAGNNLLEVEVFKQNHNITFPIFPDEDFTIHKALGEVKTPFFIAVKMEGGKSPEIIHTHLGGLTDARAFLDLMVEAYGIKKEVLLIKEVASSPTESRSDVELK